MISLFEFLRETFLLEDGEHPDPFEATYASHRDAIIKRAHETTREKQIYSTEIVDGKMINPRYVLSTTNDVVGDHPGVKVKNEDFHPNLAAHVSGLYDGATVFHPQRGVDDGMNAFRHKSNESIIVKETYKDNHDAAKQFRGERGPLDGPHPYGDSMPGMTGTARTNEELGKHSLKMAVTNAAPRAKYIPKMLKMYANGSINRVEDIGTQAKEAFAKYDKLVTQGHIRQDLTVHGMEHFEDGVAYPSKTKTIAHHQLKKMTHLRQIQSVVEHPAYAQHLQEPAPQAKEGEFTVHHETDDYTVTEPHTHEAMVALAHDKITGKKASWCIAANSKAGAQLFDADGTHNTPYPGPKFIFQPKNPKHPGEMHCVVPLAKEYRDEHDDEADYADSLRRHTNTGIQHEDEDGNYRARYPGFGHSQMMARVFDHAYEHPEQYPHGSTGYEALVGEHHGDFFKHVTGKFRSTADEHYTFKTKEQRDAEQAEHPNRYVMPMTLKDPEGHRLKHAHHEQVMDHYFRKPDDDYDYDPDDRR